MSKHAPAEISETSRRVMSVLPTVLFAATLIALIGCESNASKGAQQSGTAVPPVLGGSGGMMMGPGMGGRGPGMMMGSSMLRHRQAMMGGIPRPYRGLSNPLSPTARVTSEGEALYRANCAACHGDTGEGNGPAAAGMSPPPANIRWVSSRPMASDAYLMWAISEGGAGLGTAMPAFKGVLRETDRWKIISYLEVLQ